MPKETISREFARAILKKGFQFVEFRWSQCLIHEDVELFDNQAGVRNPDGLWRSAQGDLAMGGGEGAISKFYIRVKLVFKEGKSKFKYFGLSKKFPAGMCFKGNRMNQEGIYFGCGGGSGITKSPSMESFTTVDATNAELE